MGLEQSDVVQARAVLVLVLFRVLVLVPWSQAVLGQVLTAAAEAAVEGGGQACDVCGDVG